jgi:hypothetical protein
MYQIKFLDKHGEEINEGDLLKVYCNSFGNSYIFYVHFSVRENYIIPHDTFAWIELEKVENLPNNLHHAKNKEYEYWYAAKEIFF